MPSPSHRPNTFTANRVFIDRDAARQLFTEQCSHPQGRDEYRILNYSGIGGQGKSALCGQFELHLKQLQSQGDNLLAWAKVNFEEVDKRQPTRALLAFRLQLAGNGKLRFPAFDTAFARYFSLIQPGRNLANAHPELFRQPHDILQGLANFTESVSGVPLVGALVKLGNKVDQKLYMDSWKKRRGDDLLQGLDGFAPHELEAALPKYLGADIDDWLHDKDASCRRVVLLYDTYEALWRDRLDKTDPLVDDWIRRFVAETPAVLHVMLGREAFNWAEHDEDWCNIINPFPLDKLSDADAETYLQAVPIVDADIRERIVQGAKGIPFYLSLQVAQYEDSQRSGKVPQANEYGGAKPEILAIFTNHLPDSLRRALVVAACPRWLDDALFLNLCEKFLGGAAVVRFADLNRYSFWTENEGRHYLHAVMRDYLQADSRENEDVLYGQIHQYLFEHYDGKLQALESARDISTEHTEALSEGAYHLEHIDRAKLPYWVDKYRNIFHLAAQWAALEPLLQLSIVIFCEIGEKSDEGATLNNLSQIYKARGDYNIALDFLEKSLAIRQGIGDNAGVGQSLNNISQIHMARGDYDTALHYLQQALTIQQQIGDKSGESATLQNISSIYQARGDYAPALHYLQQSLATQQQIGDKSGEWVTLNNLSQIYSARGDYVTALHYLQQSLAIQQQIGDKFGEGATLNNLSQIYHARGDYDTALHYVRQAHAISQEIGNKVSEGTALSNLSRIYYTRGSHDTALHYLQQAITIFQQIGDKAGEGTALSNLAAIAMALSDYDTALSTFQHALTIQQQIGDKAGEGTTLNNLSQIYSARSDYDTALPYLQRAFAIQQQIGDLAGLCTTLFNMGHIHWQNSERDEAKRLWAKAYGIAKQINLAQMLDALGKLAEQLGLASGLAGWEKLSLQMSEQDTQGEP